MADAAITDGARRGVGYRAFAWAALAVLAAFLINNYLTAWRGWPGPQAIGAGGLAYVQIVIYPALAALAVVMVTRTPDVGLRADSERISRLNAFIIRAAFWAVLLIGVCDAIISTLRVEQVLDHYVGAELATELGRSQFRGMWVHTPLLVLGVLLALVTRTLGFHWLALLVVVAELLIVISRFVFSYEQSLMADLVRFWYGALFLFASAHTLVEEGHVRVDVLYAGFSRKMRGFVNAVGSLCLGFGFCWTILIIGMDGRTSIINAPIISFETTQSGVGMYVKYMMAGFLGLFASTMIIQFLSYFLDAVADFRGEPGGRDHDSHPIS